VRIPLVALWKGVVIRGLPAPIETKVLATVLVIQHRDTAIATVSP
jgi:hypothetical protein